MFDYQESAPPLALRGLIKVAWRLRVAADGDTSDEVEHWATPDGCVEVIARSRGRSHWLGEQPAWLIAGLIDCPTRLRFSADAEFHGLRLWPWTWRALGGTRCGEFLNHWLPMPDAGLSTAAAQSLQPPWDSEWPRLIDVLSGPRWRALQGMADAILGADTVRSLLQRCGRSERHVQRWFAEQVGIAPRTYLRMLRFQQMFVAMQDSTEPLADLAARRGYADQAHMARDFRHWAGAAAVRLRRRARGPFV